MTATQSENTTAQNQSCDVLVIGGGPSGSTISTLLAEKGWHVVLLEKDQHPRFHIGESLLPMNLPLFKQLGVLDQIEEIGIRKYGAEFDSMYHNRSSLFHFSCALDKNHPYSYEVKRDVFDEVLFHNAVKKGVDGHENIRVTEVTIHPDQTSTIAAKDNNGKIHSWNAKFLVDASGRDTFMAKKLGVKKRNKDHSSAALYGHFKGVERRSGKDEGNITLCWFEHGWFWIIPFKDGDMSVGAVCWPYYLSSRKVDVEQFLWDTIAMCPPVANRMKDAELVSPVTATGNYAYSADHMIGGGYIMVGDAYAFVDPVFSSGVLLAMKGAVDGADVVENILRDPKCAPKAIKKFNKNVHYALKTFSWFIYRITQPALRDMFMGKNREQRKALQMEEAVLSLLAGDLFSNTPIRGPLFMFKMFYYIKWLLNWRKNLAALRRRKRNIQNPSTQT